jgi:hypothetical protein
MDTRRFNNIKTLNDIKLEKARLRYELLVIENRLNENIQSLKNLASVTSAFSRIGYGFQMAQNAYGRIHTLVSKFRSWRKKKKKKKNESDD